MSQVITIGLDIAKNVFHAHGADERGAMVFSRKLTRGKLLEFFAGQPACVVALEACGGAHHWARQLQSMGHDVRLIPPAYVKPFVKRNKNDAIDAEAIAEAAQRPGMRFVAVKTEEQQAAGLVFRTRDLAVRQRTQLINAIRGHLAEYGWVAPRGTAHMTMLADLLEDEEMTSTLTTPAEAIARLFGARYTLGANYAEEVYPGYPGLVVAGGELRAMTWGFPLALKSKKTGQALKPKPVTNTREDKLHTAFWRDSFVNRRCLVPVSAWAEAEGDKGCMTRTWYSLPGGDPFAVAGVWRPTAEWGDAYSMVMVDGCADMAEDHNRMPTILPEECWDQWIGGTPEQATQLCCIWPGSLEVDRTPESWRSAI